MQKDPAIETAETAAPGRRAWLWPAIVIGFLALHASLWIGFATIAVTDPHFSVEPDHYRKSLAWDRTAAELRRSRELGWTVQLETDGQALPPGRRRVACRVLDRDGHPVENARVQIEAFPHAQGNQRLHAELRDEGNGNYTATLPMRRDGLWECRLRVSRGADTFSEVVLHEVSAAPGETTWQR